MKTRVVVALCITAGAIGCTTHGPALAKQQQAGERQAVAKEKTTLTKVVKINRESIYNTAEHLITDQKVRLPWDGRWYLRNKIFCIETFNGSRHDIKQYGHGVPPGGFLKFCSNGQYYFNDADGFSHMKEF